MSFLAGGKASGSSLINNLLAKKTAATATPAPPKPKIPLVSTHKLRRLHMGEAFENAGFVLDDTCRLLSVVPQSPADMAGLKADQQLLTVNNKSVANRADAVKLYCSKIDVEVDVGDTAPIEEVVADYLDLSPAELDDKIRRDSDKHPFLKSDHPLHFVWIQRLSHAQEANAALAMLQETVANQAKKRQQDQELDDAFNMLDELEAEDKEQARAAETVAEEPVENKKTDVNKRVEFGRTKLVNGEVVETTLTLSTGLGNAERQPVRHSIFGDEDEDAKPNPSDHHGGLGIFDSPTTQNSHGTLDPFGSAPAQAVEDVHVVPAAAKASEEDDEAEQAAKIQAQLLAQLMAATSALDQVEKQQQRTVPTAKPPQPANGLGPNGEIVPVKMTFPKPPPPPRPDDTEDFRRRLREERDNASKRSRSRSQTPNKSRRLS